MNCRRGRAREHLINSVPVNVKSKDVVHECETEFGVFSVTDVIDIRKRKFIVKYDLSDNLPCQLCKKIVTILFVILCQYS